RSYLQAAAPWCSGRPGRRDGGHRGLSQPRALRPRTLPSAIFEAFRSPRYWPQSRRFCRQLSAENQPPKSLKSAKPAALVVRAEELGRAGSGHRRRRRDLERERRRGHALREAVDLAGSGTAEQLEPAAGEGERRAAADRRDLE